MHSTWNPQEVVTYLLLVSRWFVVGVFLFQLGNQLAKYCKYHLEATSRWREVVRYMGNYTHHLLQ